MRKRKQCGEKDYAVVVGDGSNKKAAREGTEALKGQIRHRLATHNYEPVLRKPRGSDPSSKWNNPMTGF